MKHQAFICHPSQDATIVENLAGRLRELGIEAWVYSLDKTLAADTWAEIESKINNSHLFICVASQYSLDAKGQHRELQIIMEKFKDTEAALRIVPVVIDDIGFATLPSSVRNINGVWLTAHTVKSTAIEIASTFFPELVEAKKNQEWKYPRPGQWLEVCNIDQWTEEHFVLKDQVYFRRISPLGLFECYSPELKGLFWFAPHNLRITDILDEDGSRERRDVPYMYRDSASYDFERIGIDEMRKRGALE
jgi:TIR domain